MNVVNDIKAKMREALEYFKKELSYLRSGRANSAMLDTVSVEVYGSFMKLKELASVTTPEPRQIAIHPFDPQTAGAIVKGIERANLNLQPILEGGSFIRINVPPLDENMRKDIVKQGKKKVEEAKIAVREIRRKGNELIRKQKAESVVTEDEMKKAEKTIQELTDDNCKQIDELFSNKEKEIMTV